MNRESVGRGGGEASSTGAWAPLNNPVFAGLTASNVVSNIGTWMQSAAVAWVMAVIAPSAIMVSLVQTATTLPVFLLALPAGALADVADRRRIIIFTQAWMLLSAALLGILAMLGHITPWILLVLTLAIGIGNAINAPAWQAIIPEMVPRSQVPAAVALNSAGFNLARAVGPALGGVVLVAVGAGTTFLINAASFLAVILVLFLWRRPERESALPAERFFAAMRTGIRYVRHSPPLKAVFIRATAFILGASALSALLPLYASRYLHMGSAGYGLLLGAFGLGGVAGATGLPAIRRKLTLDQLVAVTTVAYAGSLCLIGLVHDAGAAFAANLVSGACWLMLLANFNSSVQAAAPAWVRGRCLAVYMLIFFGGIAGGSFLWGAVASKTGIPHAFVYSGLALLAGLAATFRFRLAESEQMDLTPSAHWGIPAVFMKPEPDGGPVLVTLEYVIDPESWRDFGLAMRRLRRARLRGGAFRWGLFNDVSNPGRYVESFLVESWLEHLRQHERLTVDDQMTEADVRKFHIGPEAPVVSHYLARPLPLQ
jgi:MFS family permease